LIMETLAAVPGMTSCRISSSGVTLFDFYQLPVINIADIFIFFGIIILIHQLLFLSD
ncbi:MAG: hypothetical protein A8274_1320, partial [Halanaerobium sp. 4-GBenrich]